MSQPQEPESFSDWKAFFAERELPQLIFRVAQGVDGASFNELAAARERSLDIAFFEPSCAHDDRVLAACLSRVLESLVVFMLAGKPSMYEAFLTARNASMNRALEHGYGSVSFVFQSDPANAAHAIFGGELASTERLEVQDRRAFLAGIAFGRAPDASRDGG